MERISLTNQAYEIIERKIVTLDLNPNEFITEKKLCGITGFGRMPVHEACMKLESVHLIKILPRKGMIVSPISWEGISQQIELRRAIEPILMKDAAKNASQKEREKLLRIKDEFYEASKVSDVSITIKLDYEFNKFAIKMARNPFAREAILPLWSLARRVYYMNYHLDRDNSLKVDMAHCNLMEFIAMCQATDAYNCAVDLVDKVEMLYKKAFAREIYKE